MNLQEYFKEKRNYIDSELDRLLPKESTYPQVLHRAMRYCVFAGGKRLRPILTLASAEACGGTPADAVEAACALEMIHTYTLIHDDLPAMDDDDYRRGKLTCHKVFGEANAILAGDALLTYAFEILLQTCKKAGSDKDAVLENIINIARSIGSKGLIAGQVVDMESENGVLDKNILKYIHENKTAALFRAATVTGGVMSKANEEMLASLDEYGRNYGLAFQITDDILDVEGDMTKTGKKTGSDEKKKKLTYPALYGLQESKAIAKKCLEKAIASVEIFGKKAEILIEIAKFTLNRTS